MHLNVEWRDLPDEPGAREVRTAQGRLVPASETVWMRTREVWIHAVDLDNGGSVRDFPPELHELLLEDLVRVWRRKRKPGDRDIVLEPTDHAEIYRILTAEEGDAGALRVRGATPDLVGWGIGRSRQGVLDGNGTAPPAAPPWL